MTSLQAFAAYISDRAKHAGFQTSRRRGRRALAKAACMSYGDLTRTLDGQYCPWPDELERLADTLGISLVTLLVESGMVPARPHCTGHAGDAR